MKVIDQHWEWVIQPPKDILQIMERCARTCYKSEEKITDGSAEKLIRNLIRKGHEAMIEFGVDPVVKITTNRGVTHEGVRHRPCSFAQESTRYVNYDNDNMEFIRPVWWNESTKTQQALWMEGMRNSELIYIDLMRNGWSAEKARDVLPNALKTEINIKANYREWRHIFGLRCSKAAHPQIRHIMKSILSDFYVKIPVVFDDIAERFFTVDEMEFLGHTRNEYING